MARRAIVLGSNGPNWQPRLNYAETDAQRITNVLETCCSFEVTQLSTNTTSAQAIESIQVAAAACTEGDTLLVYFSGHGDILKGKLFLLLENTGHKIFDSAINANHVLEAVNFSSAGHKLTILDCCHAGGAGFKGNDLIPVDKDDRSDLVLCASDRLERAREFPELTGGFMTYHICKMLNDRQRSRITVAALVAQLRLAAKSHNAKQPERSVPVPYLFGEERAPFLLRRPQGALPVLVRFHELDMLDKESLIETIRPLCARNASAQEDVKVELEPPSELLDRIEALKTYAKTDLWPTELNQHTRDSIKALTENIFVDLERHFRAAVEKILLAGKRPDRTGLTERAARVLEVYVTAKMLATKRMLGTLWMYGEKKPDWVKEIDNLSPVWSNDVFHGITVVSDRPEWSFWTDADWHIDGERFRVYAPMILGEREEPKRYSDDDYLNCLLPQLLEGPSRPPQSGLLRRAIAAPQESMLIIRNENFIDTITHSSPESGPEIIQIISRIISQKVADVLGDENRIDDGKRILIWLMSGEKIEKSTLEHLKEIVPGFTDLNSYVKQFKWRSQ